MFDKYKSTGNWAEDLGRSIELLFKLCLLAIVTQSIAIVVVLLVLYLTK